jgi:hypothetical protein
LEAVTDAPSSSPLRPDQDEDDILRDPYHVAPPPPPPPRPTVPRARLSPLALSSLLSALLLGPVGAILAILFGHFARREIERAGARRSGYALATLGMALGLVLTPAWGAALSYVAWTHAHRVDPVVSEDPEPPAPRHASPAMPTTPVPSPASPAGPRPFAPRETKLTRTGSITVVDLGAATASFSDELARQRAEAARANQTLVVMTTRGSCEPCRGVDLALEHKLMQTALASVRLVRVDVIVFHEDLDALHIPSERIPGFYLLAPDLTPRDGVDGGEWDDDIAENIAPVLGAFVRGKYAVRREPWHPVPSSGVTL